MSEFNRNSMCLWWPAVKDLPIPMPETVMLEEPREGLLEDFFGAICDRNEEAQKALLPEWEPYEERVHAEADKLGFPLFWRTDILSGKHRWKHTCYLPRRESIRENIFSLLEEHYIGFGIPDPRALVLREFLKLESSFRAFDEMPVSRERRYFVRDGRVVCRHAYWPEEAIRSPNHDDWRERLEYLNQEDAAEFEILMGHARLVSKEVEGYWSVDFALKEYGKWHLIDMAGGEDSWHPEDCPHAPKRRSG
ncbi:hypothetical protein LCGC14_2663390 [marine sediment metagenome]|uniref:ATP-grasp domain-containing protein n=1 Tax=marine sediment metagenome TaxID=412755 RepID=A0A0F9ADP8_9ZZZZ